MKKIMIAATLAGALFTATIATAQRKGSTRAVQKNEQMKQSTAAPMEQKATTTTKKVKAAAVKGENATKETKHAAKKKEIEVKKK